MSTPSSSNNTDTPTQAPAEPRTTDPGQSDVNVLPTAPPADTATAGEASLMVDPQGRIEISGLSQEQVNTLKYQHAQGMIDLRRRANELRVDVDALDRALKAVSQQAQQANDAGISVTATHSQSSQFGHTEVVLGNTRRAADGKMGQRDSTQAHQLKLALIIGAAIILDGVGIALTLKLRG